MRKILTKLSRNCNNRWSHLTQWYKEEDEQGQMQYSEHRMFSPPRESDQNAEMNRQNIHLV